MLLVPLGVGINQAAPWANVVDQIKPRKQIKTREAAGKCTAFWLCSGCFVLLYFFMYFYFQGENTSNALFTLGNYCYKYIYIHAYISMYIIHK